MKWSNEVICKILCRLFEFIDWSTSIALFKKKPTRESKKWKTWSIKSPNLSNESWYLSSFDHKSFAVNQNGSVMFMNIGYLKNNDGESSKYVTIKTNSRFFQTFLRLLHLAQSGKCRWILLELNPWDRIHDWNGRKNLSSCVYFHVLQTTSL